MNNIVDNQMLVEDIAQSMLMTKGNLTEVSRLPTTQMNAMKLRQFVASNPSVRLRYHELLSEQLQESGLLMAERILEMSTLQQKAYGDIENDIPSDPKMAIELSKEISRLIHESKNTNVSRDAAVMIVSKESAKELLEHYLSS